MVVDVVVVDEWWSDEDVVDDDVVDDEVGAVPLTANVTHGVTASARPPVSTAFAPAP